MLTIVLKNHEGKRGQEEKCLLKIFLFQIIFVFSQIIFVFLSHPK